MKQWNLHSKCHCIIIFVTVALLGLACRLSPSISAGANPSGGDSKEKNPTSTVPVLLTTTKTQIPATETTTATVHPPTPTATITPTERNPDDPVLFTLDTSDPARDMMTVSLSADGQTLMVVFFEGDLEIWNWPENTVQTYLLDYPFREFEIQSHKGVTLVAGYLLNDSGDIWFLRCQDGKMDSILMEFPTLLVTAMRLSPDGSLAAVGFSNGEIHLIETSSGNTLTTIAAFNDWPLFLQFSPDQRLLLADSFSFDPHTYLFDTQTGETVIVLLEEDYDPGTGFFSPDGSLLGWATMQGTQIFNTTSWEIIAELPQEGYGFSSHNQFLFVAGPENTTDIYRVQTGNLEKTLQAGDLHVLPDGTLVNVFFDQWNYQVSLERVEIE